MSGASNKLGAILDTILIEVQRQVWQIQYVYKRYISLGVKRD